MVIIRWGYVYFLSFVSIVFAEYFQKPPISPHTRRRRQSSTCVLPPHPEHGQWEILGACGKPGETVATNTLLIFKCDLDYKLNSTNPFVLCNKGWTSNMPSCEKLCPAMYSTLTTEVSCRHRDDRKIDCDEATDGTYLSYTCAPYYEAPSRFKRVNLCFGGVWSSSKPVCHPVCGKRVDNDVVPIIAGGTPAKTLEFPWVIALYRRKSGQRYEYICGGTLISRRVALTAAHCVSNHYGDPLPVSNFQIAAGKLYSPYDDARDAMAQYLNVHAVIISPQYRGASRRFLGDLAMLVTKKMFELSPVVQPACFHGVNDISLQVGRIGEVASWGNTETEEPSDEMKFLRIPYKRDDVCDGELSREWSDKYNNVDKICAGFHNQNKSLCKGDSGSGLVFKHSEDNRFYVHGVASLSPSDPQGKCNVHQNALYTKVAFYYEFIDRWLAVHQEEDCKLPPYPTNGMYFVEGGKRPPGSLALSTETLILMCYRNNILNFPDMDITCESSSKKLKCESPEKINIIGRSHHMGTNIDVPCTADVELPSPKVQSNQSVILRHTTVRPQISECVDNNYFANCDLIVQHKYCFHRYYAMFCCKSCMEAGLLPANVTLAQQT